MNTKTYARANKHLSALLALAVMLGLFMAMPMTAYAEPMSPINVKATVDSSGVTVTWERRGDGEIGFIINKFEVQGEVLERLYAPANATSCKVTTGLEEGKTYRFSVSARKTESVHTGTGPGVSAEVTIPVASPKITTQPQDKSVTEGQNTTFSVVATGTGPLSFRWERIRLMSGSTWEEISATDGSYSGITTSTLQVLDASIRFNGFRYRCVVNNSGGSTTSNAGKLTVNAAPPVVPPPESPAAPSNLTAVVAGNGINLAWKNNANNETRFVIERKEGNGGWGQLDGVNANITTYTDKNVQQGKTYTYKVNAVSSGGNPLSSGYSNEASATMPVTASAYKVTVNSGTGGGDYAKGATVNIIANTAPSGKAFDKWTASGVTLSNPENPSISFTMPGNAVTVTATYKDVPPSSTKTPTTSSAEHPKSDTPATTDETTPSQDEMSTPGEEPEKTSVNNGGGFNWLPLVLVILVVVAVGFGIAFFVLRKRVKAQNNTSESE